MKYCVGIDLGSTTTKAVVVDEEARVLGRGITNSRSNYEVACDVAVGDALKNTRFRLIESTLAQGQIDTERSRAWLAELDRRYREQEYRANLEALAGELRALLAANEAADAVRAAVEEILVHMADETAALYAEGGRRKSDFFRDLAGSRYLRLAETSARKRELDFDRLAGLFDKAILQVENLSQEDGAFSVHVRSALAQMPELSPEFERAVRHAADVELDRSASVGTGYGRQTLPFPKDQIRSEILCHGLGAHAMFPDTRTVLDIGGQDTKAIQVNASGIVTSFQMNDRCAAGCGRYLGYIADEMNLGVHELGPMACKSKRTIKINSTCTVFAGAELRERLSLGEKREDILAGLHRAIILRAMSLLARSGGVENEFTFTGGVANNPAAVEALRALVGENYGERAINISPDSIYTGALGAALFAHREWAKELVA